MKKIYIYALTDPDTNQVRYIGKTHRTLEKRYKEHLSSRDKTHKTNWIKSLIASGKLPIIELIEVCLETNWCDREKFWITQYSNLTNGTDGGEDGRPNEDVLIKMRLNNAGENNPCYGKIWTDEERKRLSESRKKVILTEEWKDNIGKKLGFKCMINGITYRSIKQASIELGINHNTIKRRIENEKIPNYMLV